MDDNEKMVTSEDDTSSSEGEEEKMFETRAEELERLLADNKYLYEVHVELVDLYRKLGDLKSMRAAYDRFSSYFPLTPAIWLTWIKDEIKLANSPSDKKYIQTLFEKAVEDYLSTDIWLEYVQFSIGNDGKEQTHLILERGLNAVGLNANEGSLLWDALREFELAHLSLCESLSEKWHEQAAKVADAFRRQLSVPLLRMDKTKEEWLDWLKELPEGHKIDPKSVEWGYQKAITSLASYKTFEERLLTAENEDDAVLVYIDYISFVKDPATIICLYERAVTQLSLNSTLWSKYCIYAMTLGEISVNVSKRALRNCPWSEDLWVLRLRILEQQQKSTQKEVMEILEDGLAAIVPLPGLNLWLSYLEYIRRSSETPEYLNKVFKQAVRHVGESGDPTCKLLRLQARLYARKGEMDDARRIWLRILHFPSHKNAVTAWLEFVALEKQYGNSESLRSLYQRAISLNTIDWPQYIADDWLMYERESGTLQEVLECEKKCAKIAPVIEKQADEEQMSWRENKKRPRENTERHPTTKRQRTSAITAELKKPKVLVSDIVSEKSVFLSNMREDIDENKIQSLFPTATAICIPTDRRGNSRCYAYVQFAEIEEVEKALSRDREPIDGRPLYISKCLLDQTERKSKFQYSTSSEEKKLFVRGLPISYSQEDVKNIFAPHGAVAVRIVLHRSGRSKGLAYVEFRDQEESKRAMKATDQMEVAGHTITVAISAPPKKAANDEVPVNSTIRHARSRLQIPLIPRSVQTKGSDTVTEGSRKTNDDFRKMLFDKS